MKTNIVNVEQFEYWNDKSGPIAYGNSILILIRDNFLFAYTSTCRKPTSLNFYIRPSYKT